MSWVITGRQVDAADPDARAYLAAVEAADTQALEPAVRLAVDAFVVGCKADGIWNAIKASCILAGARTLEGALVPLAGAAPTNVSGNFVSGDYNRKTGLEGDGTKRLNSNRNNNADPRDNNHNAFYRTSTGIAAQVMASSFVAGGNTFFDNGAGTYNIRSRSSSIAGSVGSSTTGFSGVSRAASASFSLRSAGATTSHSLASQVPDASSVHVFGTAGGANNPGRLAFYSIGESLDLALLDARVTTLINAFDAAI
jgi:hypothetical protein